MVNHVMNDVIVSLPGGYVDCNGGIHREVEITPLTGREEELLIAQQRPEVASLVTTVLQRCVQRIGTVSPITEDIIRNLLVADRQYLLLKLRELTLGDYVRATICCPWLGCGKKIMVSFTINDIPVMESINKGPTYRMELSPEAAFVSDRGDTHREVTFRLPNGGDQELISPLLVQNEAQALTLLLQRCLHSIGMLQHPDWELVNRLSPLARMEIEQQMEAVAPKVELTMESKCPECGRDYEVPFDIQDFFFGELRTNRDLLYREVHYLAYHYHWSEREIMDMPRPKRRTYIEILTEEIEKLNDVA
jgi:rRNA maturation protein Nop10